MATLSQAINQHWHNKNGGFAINYRLYAYESRTTTILDTYKDATETSKHTHPIIIQPNGKVPGEGIFLKDGAGVSYTFILKDEFDAEVSTVNDVSVASLSTEFHNFITQEENSIVSLADTSYLTSILLDNSNDDTFRAVIYTDDNLNGYSTNNFTIDTIDEITYSNIWGTSPEISIEIDSFTNNLKLVNNSGSDINYTFRIEKSDPTFFSAIIGADGADGEKGEKGDNGIQGPAGVQGIQGIQGDPGLIQGITAGDNISIDNYDINYPVVNLDARIITDEEIAKLQNLPNDTITELSLKIDTSEKGIAGGVATLNDQGQVPTAQLPGTIANVQEAYVVGFPPFESDWLSLTDGGTPLTPSDSTIYYILSAGSYENKEYRWGGTYFIELSSSLVLGNTSSTAFQGDFGEVAWEHTFDNTSNPHNVTKAQVGLGNVNNTSDANKPISTPTQIALTALDESVVHIQGSEFILGEKTFTEQINAHDGMDLGGYVLPNMSIGEIGQVLRIPESGNILEWGDATSGEEDAIVAYGYAITARITNPTPGSSWGDTLVINRDNGLLDRGDPDGLLDLDTGIFTAPADGYYYLNAQANLVPPFTSSSSNDYRAKVSTYFVKDHIGYFNMSNASTGYLNDSIGSSSNGIVYLEAGGTIYANVSYYVRMNYTPNSHTTDAYITRCSFSVHQVGITNTGSGGGGTVTGDPYSIPAFDASGDMISSTMLFKDNDYIDLGFEGDPNTPPADGVWNVSIGTDITHGAVVNENVVLGATVYNDGSLNEILGEEIYNEASGCVITGYNITNENSGRIIFGKNLTAAQCATGAGMIFGDGDIAGGCALIGRYADSTGSYGAVGQVLARNAAGELIWTTGSTKISDNTFPIGSAINSVSVSQQATSMLIGLIVAKQKTMISTSSSIETYITQTATGNMRFVIYNEAKSLLGYSDIIVNPSNGFVKGNITVSDTFILAEGTKYYIGIITDINNLYVAGISAASTFNLIPYIAGRKDNLNSMAPPATLISDQETTTRLYMKVYNA